MKRSHSWLMVLGFCALIAIGLSSYQKGQDRAAKDAAAAYPEPAESVASSIVNKIIWQPEVTVNAEVLAPLDVELSNELAGRIVALGFGPGEAVQQGQLLVKLDTREEEAQLTSARAEARLAALALDRNNRLASSGAASLEARDRATAQQASALARVEELRAIIDKQSLRAPFDAVAGLHELAVGQYLEAGTSITRLIGSDAGSWIDFKLPQHQAHLEIGDTVTVIAPRLLSQGLSAKVIARDAWVERQSRQRRFRAQPAGSSPLWPGAVVSVSVPLGDPISATLIPADALRRDAYGAHVFLLEPDPSGVGERARRRQVTAEPERNGDVIITAGLEVGQRIAGLGAYKLREGTLVSSPASTEVEVSAP